MCLASRLGLLSMPTRVAFPFGTLPLDQRVSNGVEDLGKIENKAGSLSSVTLSNDIIGATTFPARNSDVTPPSVSRTGEGIHPPLASPLHAPLGLGKLGN